MRTVQHVTDTRAIKRILTALPDHWVIRELTERDYGIDLFVEIFEQSGVDAHGHDTYSSTGSVFHAQVKGTNSPVSFRNDGQISFQLSKKAMLYAETFSTPFILLKADLSNDHAESYFLWIQRYIRDVLDCSTPEWRTMEQESFAVGIPPHNKLSSAMAKIEYIAARPRLIQELVEFRESYFHLTSQLDATSTGNHNLDQGAIAQWSLLARHIKNLRVLFQYNSCCISRQSAIDLFNFVNSIHTGYNPNELRSIPHRHNFDLLYNSLEGLNIIEEFIVHSFSGSVY
jgi:hypothetical protein